MGWDASLVSFPPALIGLVALEATADETRAAVLGRVRLGLKRDLEPAPELGDNAWRYGRLVVKLHGHNYARVEIRPSETTFLEQPSRCRSTELTLLDPLSVAAGRAGPGTVRRTVAEDGRAGWSGEVLLKKGTRYWFLVEVFSSDNPPAQSVQCWPGSSTATPSGGSAAGLSGVWLVGFRFLDGDREAAVLFNPTDQAIETNLPLGGAGTKWSIYEDHSGKGRPEGPGSRRVRLEPFRQIVAVATKP